MHRIGRTGRADANGTAISFYTNREEEVKIEIELLMNRELNPEVFPEEVEISTHLIGPEKDKEKIKFLLKKPKLEGEGAFHEKAKKNTKVNLGGPSKTKKNMGSVNRNMLREQNKKRAKKNKTLYLFHCLILTFYKDGFSGEKLHFIEEFLKINDVKIIDKLEK